MYQRKRALIPLLVAAALTLAACTNTPSADPTTTTAASTGTPSSAEVSSSSPSTESAPTSSSAEPTTSSSAEPTTSSTATSSTSKTTPPTTTKTPPKSSTVTKPTPAAEQRFPVQVVKGFPGEYLPYAKDAEKVYRGMMDTWDRALHNPKADDWPKIMTKYMAGGAYQTWRKGFQPMLDYNVSMIGYTEAKAKVTSFGQEEVGTKLLVVGIRACIDSAGTQVIDGDTGKPIDKSASGPHLWVIGVKKGPSGWRVYDLIQQTTKGKAIPCDKD